jgi:hypothetical protein
VRLVRPLDPRPTRERAEERVHQQRIHLGPML